MRIAESQHWRSTRGTDPKSATCLGLKRGVEMMGRLASLPPIVVFIKGLFDPLSTIRPMQRTFIKTLFYLRTHGTEAGGADPSPKGDRRALDLML